MKDNNLKIIIAFHKLENEIDNTLIKLCKENKTADNETSIFIKGQIKAYKDFLDIIDDYLSKIENQRNGNGSG